jgi:hypothetical protein
MADFNAKGATPDGTIDDTNGGVVGFDNQADATPKVFLWSVVKTWIQTWLTKAMVGLGNVPNTDATARANHTGTQASSTITATATNDDAAAGALGEHKETTVALGSAVALADVTPKSFGTLSLEAGDWDVWVEAQFTSASATGVTQFLASLSTVADTLDSTRLYTFNLPSLSMGTGGQSLTYMGRVKLASTTTMQGVVRVAFTGGGLSAYGKIRARRAR